MNRRIMLIVGLVIVLAACSGAQGRPQPIAMPPRRKLRRALVP